MGASTKIGLDAFVDNQELVGFATELKTGKPLSGVELSIYPNGAKVVSQNQECRNRRKHDFELVELADELGNVRTMHLRKVRNG